MHDYGTHILILADSTMLMHNAEVLHMSLIGGGGDCNMCAVGVVGVKLTSMRLRIQYHSRADQKK